MINKEFTLPFYLKTTILLIGFFVLFAIFYIAKGIIVPLIFATILAILLHPVVNFFVRKKVNRLVAIVITLILAISVIIAFGGFLFSQASRFSESWPLQIGRASCRERV